MTPESRTMVELVFNIAYLLTIWTVVGLMLARFGKTAAADRPVFKRLLWMFALLALGDSGHVGLQGHLPF